MAEVSPASLSEQLLLQVISDVSVLNGQLNNVQGQNIFIIKEQQSANQKLDKIDTLTQTVNRIAPLVDKHEAKYNQTAGAMWLGKSLWAAGAGTFGGGIAMLISWLTGRHP